MTELETEAPAENPQPREFGGDVVEKGGSASKDHMSALDVLLGADSGRVTDTIKVHKRKGLPADLILTIGSLTDREFKQCADQAEVPANRATRRGRGGEMETDGNLLQRLIVAKGVVDPDLSDQRLLTRHEAFLPEELVQKILLPGEISTIAEFIMEISGFNETSVEAVGE